MAVVIKYVFCSINYFFGLHGVQWFLFPHPDRFEMDMNLPNFHFCWLHVIYSKTPTKKKILICHVCITSAIKMLKPDFPEMEMRPKVIYLSLFFSILIIIWSEFPTAVNQDLLRDRKVLFFWCVTWTFLGRILRKFSTSFFLLCLLPQHSAHIASRCCMHWKECFPGSFLSGRLWCTFPSKVHEERIP